MAMNYSTHDWSREVLQATIDAVNNRGGQRAAADLLGIPQTEVFARVQRAIKHGIIPTLRGKKGGNNLSPEERYKVGKLLDLHCRRLPDGTAEYELGWNDERVSVDTETGKEAVKSFRSRFYGKVKRQLRRPSATKKNRGNTTPVASQIAALSKRFDDFVARYQQDADKASAFFAQFL